MSGYLAGIPMIGGLLDTIFGGIDRLTTSDEERLKFKHAMMMAAQPVIAALIAAQAEFDKAVMALRIAEVQSSDRFIRWSRPAMGWATFFLAGYALIVNHQHAETALWLFGIVNGLWSATRGAEGIVKRWAANGNGKVS